MKCLCRSEEETKVADEKKPVAPVKQKDAEEPSIPKEVQMNRQCHVQWS